MEVRAIEEIPLMGDKCMYMNVNIHVRVHGGDVRIHVGTVSSRTRSQAIISAVVPFDVLALTLAP